VNHGNRKSVISFLPPVKTADCLFPVFDWRILIEVLNFRPFYCSIPALFLQRSVYANLEVQGFEGIFYEKAFHNTLAIPFHFYLQSCFLSFFDSRESFHAPED
jgi:hypothetical protein